MKIGYVLKRFPRLSETFILNEMLALERQGVEIEVFSLKRPLEEQAHPRLKELRARVHYVSGERTPGTAAAANAWGGMTARLVPGKDEVQRAALTLKAFQIAGIAARTGVQHLHAHFASDATTAALIAGEEAGLPFSFTAHARDIYHRYVTPELDDAARRTKLRAARFVVTVSDFNRQHLQSLTGWGASAHIHRIYNGIDLDTFAPDTSIEREPDSILAVGRMVEKKGFPDLVEACRLLQQRGRAFTCRIIGDGPMQADLQRQIAAAGLSERVLLMGAMGHREVLRHMREAALMALPCIVAASGDQDGLPTVLLEALGVGLPAVSTRVAGIAEIIEDGQTGLLVEQARPDQLADALERLLADRALRSSISLAGRARALDRFEVDANVGLLRELFAASTIQSRSRARGEKNADCLPLC